MKKWSFVATLALVVSVLGMTPAHAESTASYVTLYGNGAEVSGNNAWLWRDAQVSTTGSNDQTIKVAVTDGTTSFALAFAAAPGETLVPGPYADAQRAEFQSAGHAGIAVSGSGATCKGYSGSFTVNAISSDLSTLSIDYTAVCAGNAAATLRGEIRVGVDPATLSFVPPRRTVTFVPASVAVSRSKTVGFRNLGEAPMTMTSAAVTDGADSFSVESNDCTSVAPDASCKVTVAFHPPAPGHYSGALSVTDSLGTVQEVALAGDATEGPFKFMLTANRKLVKYGGAVRLRTSFKYGWVPGRVTIRRTVGGVTRTLASGSVDATGFFVARTTLTRNTVYQATWTDGFRTAEGKVTVWAAAKVTLAASGARAKSGSTWLFTPKSRINMVAEVAPNKAGKCLVVRAQILRDGDWNEFAKNLCVRLGDASRARAYLEYQSRWKGKALRFSAFYTDDPENARQTSNWLYAKWS